jgi:hypothetical protein
MNCISQLRYNDLRLSDVMSVFAQEPFGSPSATEAHLNLVRMFRFGNLQGKRDTVIQALAILAEASMKSGNRDQQMNVAYAQKMLDEQEGSPVRVVIVVVVLLVIVILGILAWRWLR